MNIEQLKEALAHEDVYGIDEVEGVTIIEQGKWEAEGKWCYLTTIVQCGEGNYFSVTESRSDSGYWGDSERGDTEVVQVTPIKKIIETTEWWPA